MLEQKTIEYCRNEFTQRLLSWDVNGELLSNLAKIGITLPDGFYTAENHCNEPLLMPQGFIAVFGASEVKTDKIIAALSEELNVPKKVIEGRFTFNLKYEVFHEVNINEYTIPNWAAIIVGPNDHKNKNTGMYSSVADRLKANKDGDFPYTEVLDLKQPMSKTKIVQTVRMLVDKGIIEF